MVEAGLPTGGEEAGSDRPPAAESHPDGPEPPYWFWWNNQRLSWEKHQTPWKLLNYMWNRERAHVDDVLRDLWDGDYSASVIQTNASRANAALPLGCKRKLSVVDSRYIFWAGQ
jgi:hypothetical protein